MEETVQLYDDHGRPTGTAPRSRVRAENLTHAATAVLVRDGVGRILAHRRTETKDVYPGLYDFAAGGVVAAGEDPRTAAARELAEEIGVTGAALTPLGVERYTDDVTDYWAHVFTAEWDGEIRLQASEIASAEWLPPERVLELLDSGTWPVVPDTSAGLTGHVRRLVAATEPLGTGWDCAATLVEGRFVDRRPLRTEVAPRLLAETRLLPLIAPRLPLPVPVPEVLETEPLRVRHRLVPGRPVRPERLTADDGRRVGRFLRTLHDLPSGLAERAGVRDGTDCAGLLERMRHAVLPLLNPTRRPAGEDLLRALAPRPTQACLVHGDLGPSHLLATHAGLSGVIDWADARVADPALDLAWALHGTPPAFADALATAYGVTPEQRARALAWHRLGPWHEVLWGLGDGGPAYVDSGLAGAHARLPAP